MGHGEVMYSLLHCTISLTTAISLRRINTFLDAIPFLKTHAAFMYNA